MRGVSVIFDDTSAEALTEFSRRLNQQGVPTGLAYLNARVPHRFTTINEFRGSVIHCIQLIDKRGVVTPEHIQPVAMEHSFCQFVVRDGYFTSCDTAGDERLSDHPYKGVYNAYVGVPILDNAGELWGTLCHLDTKAISITDEEFDFFQRASRELSRHLKF